MKKFHVKYFHLLGYIIFSSCMMQDENSKNISCVKFSSYIISYRLLFKSEVLHCFRNLRNGYIITKGKARGDYAKFRRFLKQRRTLGLNNN